jgi:hypothetical protein
MQKNRVMKFTPESFKKFVLEEVKKVAIENKWINEDEQKNEFWKISFDEFLKNITLSNMNTTGTNSEDKNNEYVKLQLEKFHYNKVVDAIKKGKDVPKEVVDFYLSDNSLINNNYGVVYLKKALQKTIEESEIPIQSKEEILKESAENIKETKMLSEELRRMKQLLDFRNIVNNK